MPGGGGAGGGVDGRHPLFGDGTDHREVAGHVDQRLVGGEPDAVDAGVDVGVPAVDGPGGGGQAGQVVAELAADRAERPADIQAVAGQGEALDLG